MSQEQMPKRNDSEDDSLENISPAGQERRDKLTSETDDLLDEIDGVLEENPQAFVESFVQKGGQ